MPKISEHPAVDRHVRFPGDFTPTLKRFEVMIKSDPNIKEKAGKIQKIRGIFSLGIREAVEAYIDLNEEAYLNSLKKKQKENVVAVKNPSPHSSSSSEVEQ